MANSGVPDKPPMAAESVDVPAPLPPQKTPPDPVPVPPQQPPPDPEPVPPLQGLTKKQRRNLASAAGVRAAVKAEAKVVSWPVQLIVRLLLAAVLSYIILFPSLQGRQAQGQA